MKKKQQSKNKHNNNHRVHPSKPRITRLYRSSATYKKVLSRFQKNWDKMRGQCAAVKEIYQVECPAQKKRFLAFQKTVHSAPLRLKEAEPGNKVRRFFKVYPSCKFTGTPCNDSLCELCPILRNGFEEQNPGKPFRNIFFSDGIKLDKKSNDGWLIACDVICGHCDLVRGSVIGTMDEPCKRPMDLTKHNSRCSLDEVLVPSAKQILPRYIIHS